VEGGAGCEKTESITGGGQLKELFKRITSTIKSKERSRDKGAETGGGKGANPCCSFLLPGEGTGLLESTCPRGTRAHGTSKEDGGQVPESKGFRGGF